MWEEVHFSSVDNEMSKGHASFLNQDSKLKFSMKWEVWWVFFVCFWSSDILLFFICCMNLVIIMAASHLCCLIFVLDFQTRIAVLQVWFSESHGFQRPFQRTHQVKGVFVALWNDVCHFLHADIFTDTISSDKLIP